MNDSQLAMLNKNLELHNQILKELVTVLKVESETTRRQVQASSAELFRKLERIADSVRK